MSCRVGAACGGYSESGYLGGLGDYGYPSSFFSPSKPNGRHGLPAGNYLLADGHVKFLRGDNVSPGGNAANSTAAQSGGNTAAGTEAGTIAPGETLAATYSIF
jgi:prepilin-type processing-associated H-X9-DG protein